MITGITMPANNRLQRTVMKSLAFIYNRLTAGSS
jgi:hypothetical protein